MENELTMKLLCGVREFSREIRKRGFAAVGAFRLEDVYFVPADLPLEAMSSREILRHAVLLRSVHEYESGGWKYLLTYKKKQIAEDGTILRQEKFDCPILDAGRGRGFLEALGYRRLMEIRENDVVYEKDGLGIALKDVEGGAKLIEVETVEGNGEMDTIEKLKRKIEALALPVDFSDCFVKKAELELEKTRFDR